MDYYSDDSSLQSLDTGSLGKTRRSKNSADAEDFGKHKTGMSKTEYKNKIDVAPGHTISFTITQAKRIITPIASYKISAGAESFEIKRDKKGGYEAKGV